MANLSINSIGDDFGAGSDLSTIVKRIINVAMAVLGVVCVVMLIVGGYNYTMSAGDASKVTKAKNTILYAVIGLVIALLALAIVNFVLGGVTTDPETGSVILNAIA